MRPRLLKDFPKLEKKLGFSLTDTELNLVVPGSTSFGQVDQIAKA